MAVPTIAIILAGGEGTRMNSKIPKVLHPVGGQVLIEYALANAEALHPAKIYLVTGAQSREITAYAGKRAVPVFQKKRGGTGHAVQQVLPHLKSFSGNLFILYADACLIRTSTVLALRQFHQLQGGEATLLTARVEFPFGYGRIIRGTDGEVQRIVEEKDATESQKRVNEINAGAYLFKAGSLRKGLGSLKSPGAGRELFLTDSIQQIISQGGKVHALMVPDRTEISGINDRQQLARAHRILNSRRVEEHQRNGASFLNPETVELDSRVLIGRDCVIEGNVHLLGDTVLGEDCRVESGSVLRDAKLGRGSWSGPPGSPTAPSGRVATQGPMPISGEGPGWTKGSMWVPTPNSRTPAWEREAKWDIFPTSGTPGWGKG